MTPPELSALKLKQISVRGIATTLSPVVFPLTPALVNQMTPQVMAAANAFVRSEQTFALTEYGVPSLFGRIDYTITDGQTAIPMNVEHGTWRNGNGTVHPYELEERPAGMGLTAIFNPQFAEQWHGVSRQYWPEFGVIIEPDRVWYDDDMIVPKHRVHIGPPRNDPGLVLVRAERQKIEYHRFISQSISTVRSEGDKSYGVRLNWWQYISSIDQLNNAVGQLQSVSPSGHTTIVLKPLVGSRTHHLIMAPTRNGDRTPGMMTRAKLERMLQEQIRLHGGMYLQPWFPPMQAFGSNLILRIFYAYIPDRRSWRCLGGMWALRNSSVVHGAQDTILGPACMV